MSGLGQQMFFARKRSVSSRMFLRESEASAAGCFLRESEASAAGYFCAKAKRQQQQDVGHESVITGRDFFRLRSSACSLQSLICDADPQ
ncbi:hypothetical protein LSPCS325_25190 [Lysinibacillus sp. CTST325]